MKKINFDVQLIMQYLQDHKLSKTAFAKKCGVSVSVVDKVLNNQINLLSRSVVKIADVLNVSIDRMFNRKVRIQKR